FCRNIHVDLLADGGCRIADDGRGIPAGLLAVFTTLGIYPPFQTGHPLYGILHGTGVAVVNALSRRLTVEVRRDGRLWRQEYARGEAITSVQELGVTDTTGTTVTFWPDPRIFGEAQINGQRLEEYLRETSFLNPGLSLHLTDHRTSPAPQVTFRSRGL